MNHVRKELTLNELRTLFNFHRPNGPKLTKLMDDLEVPIGVQGAIFEHLQNDYDAKSKEAYDLINLICPRINNLFEWFKRYLLQRSLEGAEDHIKEAKLELNRKLHRGKREFKNKTPAAECEGITQHEWEQETAELDNSVTESFIDSLRELVADDVDREREDMEGTGRKRPMLIRASNAETGGYFLFHLLDQDLERLRFTCKHKTIRTKARLGGRQDGYDLSVEDENPAYYVLGAVRTWADAKQALKETSPSSQIPIKTVRSDAPRLTVEADLGEM